MNITRIHFESLNIPATIYFSGTDEEIEAAEEKETQRVKEIESIIFSGDFVAMEWTIKNGTSRILSHSTRQGIGYQLSYFWNGSPTMHENYIKTGEAEDVAIHTKEELLKEISRLTYRHNLEFEVVTA